MLVLLHLLIILLYGQWIIVGATPEVKLYSYIHITQGITDKQNIVFHSKGKQNVKLEV